MVAPGQERFKALRAHQQDADTSLTSLPNRICIVEYDPGWPQVFEEIKSGIAPALGGMAAAIEHVGSTSIPGLAAKPIIDIDVLLAAGMKFPKAVECLADLGYVYEGNLGIPGREAFLAPTNTPPHHLYVCLPANSDFRKHVAFRDYLRSHPIEAQTYGELKRSLAAQFPGNRSAYVAGKTGFVARVTALAMSSTI
jgi:GrpB-like predicted nucleotidyltransferase (UPF0157 family)